MNQYETKLHADFIASDNYHLKFTNITMKFQQVQPQIKIYSLIYHVKL
jgi:hypothetical protein